MVFSNFTFNFLTEMWEFKHLNYPENAHLFLEVENMCIVTKLYKQRWNAAHCTKTITKRYFKSLNYEILSASIKINI